VHFFFSKQKRHKRFSRDWSSDVCSSDLGEDGAGRNGADDVRGTVREVDRLGGGTLEGEQIHGWISGFRLPCAPCRDLYEEEFGRTCVGRRCWCERSRLLRGPGEPGDAQRSGDAAESSPQRGPAIESRAHAPGQRVEPGVVHAVSSSCGCIAWCQRTTRAFGAQPGRDSPDGYAPSTWRSRNSLRNAWRGSSCSAR